jgi:hypothetical protein
LSQHIAPRIGQSRCNEGQRLKNTAFGNGAVAALPDHGLKFPTQRHKSVNFRGRQVLARYHVQEARGYNLTIATAESSGPPQ